MMILRIALLMAFAGGTAAAAPPPGAFAMCSACHATQAGAASKLGPNLYGVVGRKAGAAPGFAYSPAMKASGVTWTEKSLDSFLTNPQQVVPGSRMPYAGDKDPARRAAIIQYLSTLH